MKLNMLSTFNSQRMTQKADLLKNQKVRDNSPDQQLKKVASDFEALMVQQMMESMRESVGESELLPQSQGEKVFQSMLDGEYASMASQKGELGLSRIIYEQMRPVVKKSRDGI
ncbi:MAG: rod-binding protein [SAR324 cluster bacterium]|nr:rod-binding protein [SAR324 cluster bacterium]